MGNETFGEAELEAPQGAAGDLARMRREYEDAGIDASTFDPDPVVQFERWLAAAVDAGLDEPNAMVLATVDAAGQPWARFVLLKGVSDDGLLFFTNYGSNKAAELDGHPRASLTFGWQGLRRQVNIAGSVARLSDAESDEYWAVRPRESKLGAWASDQSRPLADRDELMARFAAADADYPGDVPRPPHWGGYRLAPHTIEFWQGRPNRLHDRLRYTCSTDRQWTYDRLNP